MVQCCVAVPVIEEVPSTSAVSTFLTPVIQSNEPTKEILPSTNVDEQDEIKDTIQPTNNATPSSTSPLEAPPISKDAHKNNKMRRMPGSFVHKKAKLGENVYVGLFVYVGEGAEIGDNAILMENTMIPAKAKIADNTMVIPDPTTDELIDILQDMQEVLEEVNDNYKEEMQPKVEEILSQEK